MNKGLTRVLWFDRKNERSGVTREPGRPNYANCKLWYRNILRSFTFDFKSCCQFWWNDYSYKSFNSFYLEILNLCLILKSFWIDSSVNILSWPLNIFLIIKIKNHGFCGLVLRIYIELSGQIKKFDERFNIIVRLYGSSRSKTIVRLNN